MAWAIAAAVLVTAALGQVYPRSKQPGSKLYAVSEAGRGAEELLALDSLAGNLARQSPRVYRVRSESWETDAGDAYSTYLSDMRAKHGIAVDVSLVTASLRDIVQAFVGELRGYVRCDAGTASTSAAVTLAAASEGLLVAASGAVEEKLQAAGLTRQRDLRGATVNSVIDEALPKLSHKIFVFQDATKMGNLGDYAIFARAAMMAFGSDSAAQSKILSHAQEPAAGFGWGPENDFVATLNKHGVYVHASDWSKNLAALGNINAGSLRAQAPEGNCSYGSAVHTVSFLMSDGDNIQWTLGGWTTDEKYWGSSQRGTVPVGWTFSPAARWLAPTVLEAVLAGATSNDELVAGPSGVGYMYPSQWSDSSLAAFSSLTFEGMKASAMKSINVIGKGDNEPNVSLMEHLMADDSVDGMIYYPFGDGYAGLHGKMWRTSSGKPVVSSRYSMWGNGTSGDMVGVDTLVKYLKVLPKDDQSIDGYSLIAAHAWSHSYADIVDAVTKLKAAGGFDIVLPSELIRRLHKLPTTTCHCDHPGQAVPNNDYTCSDGSKSAYCSSKQKCVASGEFSYPAGGDFSAVCVDLAVPTCHCSGLGKQAPNNGYSCSDSSKSAFCSSTQTCTAPGEWFYPTDGDWSTICVESLRANASSGTPFEPIIV